MYCKLFQTRFQTRFLFHRFLLFHFTTSFQCWAKTNTKTTTTHSCAFWSHLLCGWPFNLTKQAFFFFFCFFGWLFCFLSSKRLRITKGETSSCMQWLIMSRPSLVFSFFESMFLRFLYLWFTKQAVGPVSFNTRHGPRAKYTPGWVDRLHAWCTCTCPLMSRWMGGRWNQGRYTKQSRMKIPKEQQKQNNNNDKNKHKETIAKKNTTTTKTKTKQPIPEQNKQQENKSTRKQQQNTHRRTKQKQSNTNKINSKNTCKQRSKQKTHHQYQSGYMSVQPENVCDRGPGSMFRTVYLVQVLNWLG